ncbi:deoxycytidylate 5-hydroxymethyltransferase [Agrobacterium phage Atu_ph04]|uniref:Deoxycytidylate 5-hydroxymethyltransferase n=1 Tax=Agrobacterium phage Atu_ph04 TaxID=2024263 RepID=A0A223VZQ9_9CAUD|nr:thymidylate synthase [Agrobacterium phage Atu_ph04]ASV44650.1 deoxycytidylate 5-hydroxymethyltransferase [Agrobacterium phage Atu_ph04]
MVFDTFSEAYIDAIYHVMGDGKEKDTRVSRSKEIRMFSYTVLENDIDIVKFEEDFRLLDLPRYPSFEYAQKFADWVLSGNDKISEELFKLNPGISKYDANQSDLSTYELPSNFSMFYGPRISEQLWQVIDELNENKDTRRAFISVLDGINDNKLLEPLRTEEIKTVEYPCTVGFNFEIDDDTLNLEIFMRSQNLVTVWPYDYFIAVQLLKFVAQQTGRKVGSISAAVASMHIYKSDYDFAKSAMEKN